MRRLLVGLVALLTSCGAPDNGEFWAVAGKLPDGPKTVFVRIRPGGLTSRRVYEQAADGVCRDAGLCKVMFFSDGDPLPPTSSLAHFFAAGGFGLRPALATWVRSGGQPDGAFGFWDCARAGAVEAPPQALCSTANPSHLPAAGPR